MRSHYGCVIRERIATDTPTRPHPFSAGLLWERSIDREPKQERVANPPFLEEGQIGHVRQPDGAGILKGPQLGGQVIGLDDRADGAKSPKILLGGNRRIGANQSGAVDWAPA